MSYLTLFPLRELRNQQPLFYFPVIEFLRSFGILLLSFIINHNALVADFYSRDFLIQAERSCLKKANLVYYKFNHFKKHSQIRILNQSINK